MSAEQPNNAPHYPDISDFLALKANGREAASKKSFAEKLAIVEALNARLAPLRAARERRKEGIAQPILGRRSIGELTIADLPGSRS